MSPLIVVAAIIRLQGTVLMSRRRECSSFPLLWEFPGGKVEEGEDPQDALVREIREELGIGISVDSVYDVVFYRYPEKNVLLLSYNCTWNSGIVRNLEVEEHQWCSPGELLARELLPADVSLAQRLFRELTHASCSTGI